MRRVVVLQWSRLGDVLQTRVLLRKLRICRPGVRVTLCADARYLRIARCFPEVDDVWPVDLAHLSALARHSPQHGLFLSALSPILTGTRGGEIEEAIVLSRSLPAALCAELLRPRHVEGYRQCEGRLIAPRPIEWIESHMRQGAAIAVHVADAWASLCRGEWSAQWLRPLSFRQEVAKIPAKPLRSVALICDAGEPYRRIPALYVRALVNDLRRDARLRVELHGATADSDGGSTEEHAVGERVTDYRGRTSIEELCERLAASDLVIGPDTGALHLAAAFNVPVIGMYFGGAMPCLTGPYSPRAVVVQNPDWSDSGARNIADLARAILFGESLARLPQSVAAFVPSLDLYGVVYGADNRVVTSDRAEFFARFGKQQDAAPAERFAHSSAAPAER